MSCGSLYEERYQILMEHIDWKKPEDYVDEARYLVEAGHVQSMDVLAILLGEIDENYYRDEIISLYEKAFSLGSLVAAGNLALQYEEWGESFMARLWRSRDTLK